MGSGGGGGPGEAMGETEKGISVGLLEGTQGGTGGERLYATPGMTYASKVLGVGYGIRDSFPQF